MKRRSGIAIGIAAIVAAGGSGYWFGARTTTRDHAAATATTAAADAGGQRKILYYRNPMGLPDTSPTPKKDPMGMDYIPVYAGEAEEPAAAGQVSISSEKIQKIGVRTEAAQMRQLDKSVRAAGRIEPDERRTYTIAPKFEGYVERLHVNVTGQAVGRGQALFEIYSPELVSAQREYAIAMQGVDKLKDTEPAQTGMQQLAAASLQRLKNWDISEEQIKNLAKSAEARRTLTFRSPVAGIVSEKKAIQGMRFMPGEALYQITDLSAVWVIADVFEQDIGQIRTGARAKVRINAYPDKVFEGRVSYVYPTLKSETRTVPVRLELANPGQLLKPAMFAQVELPVGGKAPVLTVPVSSVIDSGTRQIVLVQKGEGRFEPREVKLGERNDNYVAVREGIKEGEAVVVAANFLIDAESNLKAVVGGMENAGPATGKADASAARSSGHRAQGTVDGVDAKAGTVALSHGPVPSLKWPAMTMEFKVANGALLTTLKPGAKVDFEFVERAQGEWVITGAKPTAGNAPEQPAASQAAAAAGHAGH